MLAASGRPPGALEDWQIEPKLDGYRVIVGVTATELVVRTRGGRDITSQVPELARLCHIGAELVLDGELIAGAGRPEDFYGLAGAVALRARLTPLTFVVFDLLRCHEVVLVRRPLHERRQLLEHVGRLAEGVLHVVPCYPGPDLEVLLAGATELSLEGIMLKHRDGPYRPGRRVTTWRKMKSSGWAEHRSRRFERGRRLSPAVVPPTEVTGEEQRSRRR